MDQTLHSPEAYDFRQYDRVWQRVAPDLEPYPGMHMRPAAGAEAAAQQSAAAPQSTAVPQEAEPVPAAVMPRQEGQLPGASPDPCCMGSAAAEMLEVLAGFIEEELADRRYFLAMSRQAPVWARQRLRDIAADEGAHARRLMAVYYLITGECYRPAVSGDRICIGRWCPALRERYHTEACSGLNYARSADGTTDPCLVKLLNELSADEYRHAEELMAMLERAIQG